MTTRLRYCLLILALIVHWDVGVCQAAALSVPAEKSMDEVVLLAVKYRQQIAERIELPMSFSVQLGPDNEVSETQCREGGQDAGFPARDLVYLLMSILR